MTVLINGSVHLPAGDREKALAETADLVAETRTQKGCRHYVWSADPTSNTEVYVYENWASVEDLAAHLAGPTTRICWPHWVSTASPTPRFPNSRWRWKNRYTTRKASPGQIFLPSEPAADTL